jgi:hypothetical protein
MTYRTQFLACIALAVSLPTCAQANTPSALCLSSNMTVEQMESGKNDAYSSLNKHAKTDMASALVNCLGHPDPAIRDGVAYEGLTSLLRSNSLPKDDIRIIRDQLLSMIGAHDPEGFAGPFAALVLSEVARTDRVEPYLTDAELEQFVQAASTYVAGVNDYRGFSDSGGWRHGVAHGADWIMQLSLNKALTEAQANTLLQAIRVQVPSGDEHAYIHGEPGRLARPVLFIAMRGDLTEQDWTNWLSPLVDPAPMSGWGDAYKSEDGLARLHNVKSFLQALYVSASVSANEDVKTLILPVTEALQTLP